MIRPLLAFATPILVLSALAQSGCSSADPCSSSACEGSDAAVPDAESCSHDCRADASTPRVWAQPYFPQGDGLQWRYRALLTDGGTAPTCTSDGTLLTQTQSDTADAGQLPDGGRAVSFLVTTVPNCFGLGPAKYALQPDALFVYDRESRYRLLRFPPKVGDTWATGLSVDFTWVSHQDSFSLGGRTYQDCWEVRQYQSNALYCHGIGMIQYITYVSGFSYRWDLESTNF